MTSSLPLSCPPCNHPPFCNGEDPSRWRSPQTDDRKVRGRFFFGMDIRLTAYQSFSNLLVLSALFVVANDF